MQALADALEACKKLESLTLGDCALGDEGGAAVFKALQSNFTLLSLDVSDNGMGGSSGEVRS